MRGALIHEPDDSAAVSADIVRLKDAAFREQVLAQGFRNASGYSNARMMRQYEDLYGRVQ